MKTQKPAWILEEERRGLCLCGHDWTAHQTCAHFCKICSCHMWDFSPLLTAIDKERERPLII